ncbi:MAG: polysaccharide deacetylase family protein [Aggregatilineales bacterium]
MRERKRILTILITIGLLVFLGSALFAASAQRRGGPIDDGYQAGGVEWDGTLRRIRVPILMYHYVSEPPEDADEMRIALSVTPAMFRQHMDFLFFQGYTPISLYHLHEALLTGLPLPPQPVILTFDDGHIDHYTNVFPVLREYGFTATFFIITATADHNHPDHLSWDQIAEMARAGMSMESHTRDHVDLRGRDYDFLVYQLLGAQESLEYYTGRTPHLFAYPAGNYDAMTLTVLRTLPVWRAVTTRPGVLHTTDNALALPRLRISNTTGVPGLRMLLETEQ